MVCPNCGTANEASFKFCLKCGKPLAASAPAVPPMPPAEGSQPMTVKPPVQAVPPAAQVPATPPPTRPADASNPFATRQMQQPYNPPAYQPSYTPPPQPAQAYPPTYPPQGGVPQPPQGGGYPPAQYGGQPGAPNSAYQYGSQGSLLLSLRGPFAGYGRRRRHIGWLLDNKGDCADQLSAQVKTRFHDRRIPQAEHLHTFLTAKGVLVENRPYFILRRGLASLGLYIGQFGKDLYISLASYLKPPVSYFRVAILGLMVIFWLYMALGYSASLEAALGGLMGGGGMFGGMFGDSGSTPNPSTLINLLCVIGPLGALNNLALFLFAVYSVYKWVTDNDIMAGLRTTPNEFNEDDLMAMEKAVEGTVRMAMDDIGLNPSDLRPANVEPRGRLI